MYIYIYIYYNTCFLYSVFSYFNVEGLGGTFAYIHVRIRRSPLGGYNLSFMV